MSHLIAATADRRLAGCNPCQETVLRHELPVTLCSGVCAEL